MIQPLKKSLAEIADYLGAKLYGDATCVIDGIAPLQSATQGQLSFLSNPAYKKHLVATLATVVILKQEDVADCPTNALVMDNPYAGYAKIASLLVSTKRPK